VISSPQTAPRWQVWRILGARSRRPVWRANPLRCVSSTDFCWMRGFAAMIPAAHCPAEAGVPCRACSGTARSRRCSRCAEAANAAPEGMRLLALLELLRWFGPARDRTGLAAAQFGAARCAVSDDHRQGRPGAHGPGQRAPPRHWRDGLKSAPVGRTLGLSQSARVATSRACACSNCCAI